jgi:hypothetical protein
VSKSEVVTLDLVAKCPSEEETWQEIFLCRRRRATAKSSIERELDSLRSELAVRWTKPFPPAIYFHSKQAPQKKSRFPFAAAWVN